VIQGNVTFRVTCKRSGEKTKSSLGTSMDIAKCVGSIIQQHFKWKVSLTTFDIEVSFAIFFNDFVQ
jgi:adenylyl- and sulfurtransferase ThiI